MVLFEPASGAPVCALDAGAITAIRTAAATAVATDALARPDARRLALLGYGEQATTHVRALREVRRLESITVWGRSPARAEDFARRTEREVGIPVRAAGSAREAVAEADVVCTLTAASEPILLGEWVRPGTHVNLVGSGYLGPVEVDSALVAGSRFVADSREGCLRQGAEFVKAKEAGLIGDDHLVAEIGEVLRGRSLAGGPRRRSPSTSRWGTSCRTCRRRGRCTAKPGSSGSDGALRGDPRRLRAPARPRAARRGGRQRQRAVRRTAPSSSPRRG